MVRKIFILFVLPAAFELSGSRGFATHQGTVETTVETTEQSTERLRTALQQAEQALRDGETEIAESRYRTALQEGWLLLGALAHEEERFRDAREAFEKAAVVAASTRRAHLSLALVEMQSGDAERAVTLLRALKRQDLKDGTVRQLLPRALMAADLVEEAIQEMQELRVLAPEAIENTYALARAHLALDEYEAAAELFEELARRRPIAETRVLIGRTYRDFGVWEPAHEALEEALEMDPTLVRAHYYLGSVDLLAHGLDRLDEAMGHLESELEISPDDAMSNLYLGAALVERRRYEEALPRLRSAARLLPGRIDPWQFLGRAHLALEQYEEAIETLEEALRMAAAESVAPGAADGEDRRQRQISSLHYQLAQALRRSGRSSQAQEHFALAKQSSSQSAEESRELLDLYLEGEEQEELLTATTWPLELVPFSGIDRRVRASVSEVAHRTLVQAYFNLGVQETRAGAFRRAAALYGEAARLDPDFPRVHFALGTALFNSAQYPAAALALDEAFARDPGDAITRRLLALARFNEGEYGAAAALLAEDPERATNPTLEYTYAAALVRSGRSAEAEPLFARLLQHNADWPELNVLLGQASAQQDDFETAIRHLKRAVQLNPGVAEAHATLGDIYLRQGQLDAAESALETELLHHPRDVRARHTLAVVLDLNRKPQEAREVLQELLVTRPAHSPARYLLGKLLMAEGAHEEARSQLEAAAELTPDEPNVRYQLGQAYQRLGQLDAAAHEFEVFRRLKAQGADP